MIPVNRDTIMLVATIVCAIGIIFLFKELNKTKEELNSFKTFSTQVVKHLNAPTQVKIEEEKVEVKEEEEKVEEKVEK